MSFSSYNEDSDEEDEDEDSDEGEEGEEESSCDEEEVTSEESDNESNRKDVVGMKSDTGGGIKKKQFIQPTIIAPTASSPSTSPSLHNQVIETLPEMVSGFFLVKPSHSHHPGKSCNPRHPGHPRNLQL